MKRKLCRFGLIPDLCAGVVLYCEETVYGGAASGQVPKRSEERCGQMSVEGKKQRGVGVRSV